LTQQQPQQQQQQEEDDDEEIPSDLTIDHHPGRMSEYHLQYQQQSEQVQEQQLQHENQHDGWMLGDDYCVSDRCKLLKQNTQRFKKNSAPLSDLRIL
jgi:hypothetical protein